MWIDLKLSLPKHFYNMMKENVKVSGESHQKQDNVTSDQMKANTKMNLSLIRIFCGSIWECVDAGLRLIIFNVGLSERTRKHNLIPSTDQSQNNGTNRNYHLTVAGACLLNNSEVANPA